MSTPLRFHKVYHRDGGPSSPQASGFHVGPSKKTMAVLSALQSISDKGSLQRRSRNSDKFHMVQG